jgi:hypothetical protein
MYRDDTIIYDPPSPGLAWPVVKTADRDLYASPTRLSLRFVVVDCPRFVECVGSHFVRSRLPTRLAILRIA